MKNLLEEVRAELRRLGNTRVRESIDRFFTEDQRVKSYGVAMPAVKKISQDVYREVKKWPVADRDRFCTELFASGMNEEGALVCYVYRRFGKQCGAREFRLFTRWLDRYVGNWGHTDGLGLWLLGSSIANDASLIDQLDAWTRSKNRWKRRAAAVALVPSARRGVHTAEILRIAARLVEDQDDMVRKGVGWLLKETYPKRPRDVVRFLIPRRERISRLVLRYAAEKMPAQDRQKVLSRD
jgi:3-methyladenine DNA glycosylase AlkD